MYYLCIRLQINISVLFCFVLFCSVPLTVTEGGGEGGGRGWRLTYKRTGKKKPKEVLIRNDTFTDTP